MATSTSAPGAPGSPTTTLLNVLIPTISPSGIPSSPSTSTSPTPTYDLNVQNRRITSITRHTTTTSSSAPPSLLLPALTHPHIHLDKPYLLTSNCPHHHQPNPPLPTYTDLSPQSGTFPEALSLTSAAKSRFTPDDLLLRGRQLLATSYTQGVTSARCFVEVDSTVGRKSVEAGLQLQKEWRGLVGVQICAFAQDPVFTGEDGLRNREVMEELLREHLGERNIDADDDASTASKGGQRDEFSGIKVLGSTPYVEGSRSDALRNIEWAVKTAMRYDLHLDFHLDYNLDESKPPEELLVWEVLRVLETEGWPKATNKQEKRRTVVLGHCSALTLLSHRHLTKLAKHIEEADLPVYFVGLPTSDLYMMGRPEALPPGVAESDKPSKEEDQIRPMSRLRGTLNAPLLRRLYGIKTVIGVNNVGNAFTPYGSGDPLELASFCVGVMQDGTEMGVRVLFEGVSVGARRAIGLEEEEQERKDDGKGDQTGPGNDQTIAGWLSRGMEIERFGLLLVKNEENIGVSSNAELMKINVPARQRLSVRHVVWDVPRTELRSVIR